MSARVLPSGALFFEFGGPPMDPSKETPAEWMERFTAAGHCCCMCPVQAPPMACCNAGHDEAVATWKASQSVGGSE